MANEEELKKKLAKNLIYYRKNNNLTQLQLAEKLSYSDKAISKWERGESVPDILTLKALADLYHCKIDDLLKEKNRKKLFITKNKLIISLLSVGLVWLIAVVTYMFSSIISESLNLSISNLWMIWVYATLPTFIIALIFAKIWGKRWMRFIFVSGIVVSAGLIIHLHLLLANIPSSWLVWCVVAALEILVVLWYSLRFKNKDIN